jgi:hypothetical protein
VPNYVTHRAWAQGSQAQMQRLIQNHFTQDQGSAGSVKKYLDFETIIPSSNVVRQTQSGSCPDFGARLLEILSGKSDYEEGYDAAIGRQEGEEPETAIRRFLKEHPEYEKFGRFQLQCLEETGYKDWYDWNTKHWGTKWNACEGEIVFNITHDGETLMEFTFDTAWSVPEPIWRKLAELFPDVVFEIAFFDESWIFAGRGNFNSPGEQDGFDYYDNLSPQNYLHRSLYHKVYGREYIPYADEELSASGGD